MIRLVIPTTQMEVRCKEWELLKLFGLSIIDYRITRIANIEGDEWTIFAELRRPMVSAKAYVEHDPPRVQTMEG